MTATVSRDRASLAERAGRAQARVKAAEGDFLRASEIERKAVLAGQNTTELLIARRRAWEAGEDARRELDHLSSALRSMDEAEAAERAEQERQLAEQAERERAAKCAELAAALPTELDTAILSVIAVADAVRARVAEFLQLGGDPEAVSVALDTPARWVFMAAIRPQSSERTQAARRRTIDQLGAAAASRLLS